MKDTIYRADAIKAVRKIVPVETDIDSTLLDKAEVIVELSALPSAEPSLKAIKRQIDEHWYLDAPSAEAVQGEWIDIDNYYRLATCSHCHKVTMFEKWGEYTKPYNFCPNCGAKMKGADDERHDIQG